MRGRFISLFRARERGQVLLLFGITIPILLGMTGMAVDLGAYATKRRDMQNAADAAALAASRALPDATAAETAAIDWGEKNGIDAAEMDVTITGGNTAPRVRVVIDRNHEFFFMRAVGLEDADVSAAAAAIKASFAGDDGVVPWSITEDTLNWARTQPLGTEVTLKYDPDDSENGNFGAIRIDGSGASDYETAVKYGSNSELCSVHSPVCTTAGCPGTYPGTCNENAPECDGPQCPPKTGNNAGPTRDAVDFRMNNTSTSCDAFGEVFTGPNADGRYGIVSQCNPWIAGGGGCPDPDTSPPASCSRRVIIIPVIDTFGNGSSDPVTIQSFALIFLTGQVCEGNGPGQCEVRGIFVQADVTTNSISGAYDEGASIHFTKLVE